MLKNQEIPPLRSPPMADHFGRDDNAKRAVTVPIDGWCEVLKLGGSEL